MVGEEDPGTREREEKMNENADLIFGVDTSEAVGNLNRLSKALQGVYDQMGKGSANPSRALAKNTEEMGAAARTAQAEFDELARKANEAARVMVSSSRKIGGAYTSIRVEADASAEAIKKWEKAVEEAANNPETALGYERQKQQIKDLADYNARMQRNMTDAWHKELHRRNEIVKKKEQEISKYVLDVQSNMTEAYYRELDRRNQVIQKKEQELFNYNRDIQNNMTDMYHKELERRSKYAENVHDNMTRAYVGELRRREQAAREHERKMEQIEREGQARREQQKNLAMSYFARSDASRLRVLEEIQRLQNTGRFSSQDLDNRYGSAVVADVKNIEALQRQMAAQQRVLEAERRIASERNRGVPSTDRSTDAILRNNKSMQDARGLARGLTGALGQLWLTYGAVTPLLAGAAVGSIARQTYTAGKDVEYRLKMLEALGNRPISVSEMMPAVHGSMKTPLEAAQGLQELAQAGLTADQSLAALNTTLQLATLGEMSVAEAALTTTAALSTFHLGVQEASRVGDVFAKTASISNTTVKGIAEAMKQAGSAASIYGVSLEETSAQIAILAQNGIRGSAAGTAIRNAMTEIHAPTKKAQEIMKQFNIEMYDDGKARNYIEVLKDLRQTYYTLDEAGQNALLKGMFNERSRRAIQIYMQNLDELASTVDKVTDSQFFLLDANLKLLNTVEGASNRMSSVLQQSLVEAFDELKPSIMSTIRALESMFASEGFKTGVKTLSGGIANLTELLADNAGLVVTITKYYAILRVTTATLGGVMSTYASLQSAVTGLKGRDTAATLTNTAAINANSVAQTANNATKATAATRIVTLAGAIVRVTNVLGILTLGVTAGVSALNAYRQATANVEFAQDSAVPSLRTLTQQIRDQNAELVRNIKLQRDRALGNAAGQSIYVETVTANEKELERVKREKEKTEAELRSAQQNLNELLEGQRGVGAAGRGPGQREAVERVRTLTAALEQQNKTISDITEGLKEAAQRREEFAANQKAFEIGDIAEQGERIFKQLNAYMVHGDQSKLTEGFKSTVDKAKKLREDFNAIQNKTLEDVESYKFKMEELYNEGQSQLNTYTIPDKPNKALERALEKYEEWQKNQEAAIKTNQKMVQAYLEGEESVRNYRLELEIEERINKDRTGHYAQIRKTLEELHKTQDQLRVAQEAYNLMSQTKDLDSYVKVLQAQSKGYEQGRKALSAYNKEQALQELIQNTSKDNWKDLTEIIERFNQEWDRNDAAKRRNEDMETLNIIVQNTKNSTQKFHEELKRLEGLKYAATTTEQIEALRQAIRNLHIENNTFLQGLNQLFDGMDKSFGNMWQSMLSEGKFTLKSLSDTFKNTLAEMAHAALTKPIIISLQNAVMGTNIGGGWGDVWGGGGAQGSVSKALGGGGNFSLLTGFAGSAAGSVQSIGGTLASMDGILGDFGANLVMHSDTIGKALDWGGAALSYGSSIYQMTKGSWGAGIGGAAGQFVGGPIGSFIGSSLGGMLDKAFKGETRSGGGFVYNPVTDSTRFGGGPSGGYGGAQGLSVMNDTLKGFAGGITSLFDMLNVTNVTLSNTIGSWESSTKGRGGTSSGGALNINGQDVFFGSVSSTGGAQKGAGYGGRTGTAEEMFENMTKDMVYSTLEAWKLASAELPRTISDMLNSIDIRSTSIEQAEVLAQTIISVTSEITSLTQAMSLMPLENFKEVTFDLAYELAQASGGVSNLTQGLSSFYDKFTSETEKHNHNMQSLTQGLRELNMGLPLTREGFRHLVDSLGQVNSQNSQTISSLLQLSNLADTYYREEERLAEQRHQEEVRRQEERRQAQEQAYRDAQSYTDKLMNAFKNLAQKQIRELESVSKATDDIAQALSRALNDQITSIQSLTTSLETTIRSLRSSAGVGGMQAQQGWDLINTVIRSGELPSESDLNAAITAIQQSFGNGSYMSAFERDRDQLLLANKLEEINDIAGPQLSIAEQQLKVMEDQLAELRDGTKRAITLANLSQAQINAIREVDDKTAASVGLSATQVEALRDSNRYAEVLQNLTRDQITGILGVKGDTANLNGLTQKQLDELIRGSGVSNVIKSLTDAQLKKLTEVDSKTAQSLGLSNQQFEAIKTGNKETITLQGLTRDQITGILGVKGETSNLSGLSQAQIDAMKDVDLNTLTVAELTERLQTSIEAESLANKQIATIQNQLNTLQAQYDQLRGLNTSMNSLDQGMRLLAVAMKAEQAAKPKPVDPKAFGGKDFTFSSQTAAKSYILSNPGLLEAFTTEVANGWTSATDYLKYAQFHYSKYGWSENRKESGYKNQGRTHRPKTTEEGWAYISSTQNILNEYTKALKAEPWRFGGDSGALLWTQLIWDQHGPIQKYAKGGYHTGGLRLVGEYGPELEVTGPGRIHNVHRTQQMLDSLQHGSNKTLDENGQLAVLTQEVRNLREDNNRVIRALIEMQHRNVRMLERWETDGLPETRVWEIDSEQFSGGSL